MSSIVTISPPWNGDVQIPGFAFSLTIFRRWKP
jgi:hypothetical protein